jgi:drug/metabolite transporter (DMT)-like permease
MENKKKHEQAIKIMILSAVIFSFSPIIVKFLDRASMGKIAIGFWRCLIGGITLLVLVLIQRKYLWLSLRMIIWLLFIALFFSMGLVFWIQSVVDTSPAMGAILCQTQVLWTALLSLYLLKEKLSKHFFIAVISAIIGISMLVGLWSTKINFAPIYIRGIVLGLLSGVFLALVFTIIKKVFLSDPKISPVVVMTWVSLGVAFFLGVGSIFEDERFIPLETGWKIILLMVIMGVFIHGLAWLGNTHVLSKIEVHLASIIYPLQVVLAFLWEYLLFTKTYSLIQWVGAAITLIAIYFGSIRENRDALQSNKTQ